ncbi:MAG: alpha/beta hydrolase [Candidatus Tectomicrobia bacterium]|nr:alpha/beta hydrolase [Candidatus Tectomicrobia bacterium]
MTYRDETLSVRGREVHLLRGGQGQPLLFLHDPWAYRWLPVHDRLAAQYQVIIPIHPGFAGSGGLEELDRIEDLVFHYLDLCEALRLEQPILLGASLGGWIAAEFAIRYASMLRALILVDALGVRVPGAPAADLFQLEPARVRAALFADATTALAHELVPDTPPPESIEAMLKARQVFARFAWQFPDSPKLASYLYRVKCPTLVVWGEHDGVVPVAHGRLYQAEITGAECRILPSCGHLPHVERPETLTAVVLEYLERVGTGS